MNQTTKITLLSKPEKVGNSRLFKFPDHTSEYIPETCFFGWNPGTMQAEVETWILDKKGIKYKL